MRIMIIAALALLASACGEEEEPACCAIQPQHACRSDMLNAGATLEELAIIMGPSDVVCPSDTFSEARMKELEPAWTRSAACRTVGSIGRLTTVESGQCEVKGAADFEEYQIPSGVTPKQAADCAAGLAARGVKDNEIWLMMHEPAGICPNNGVSEARIREIIANDWAPAGCMQFTNEQMLGALETGACGGDAG